MTRAVLLTGPLGSGKTAVAVQIGELLDSAGVPHAVVDLDWLCWAGPGLTGAALDAVLVDNLAAVRARYVAAGITTFVLARTVTSLAQVEAIRAAAGGALVALRLSVPDDERRARLAARGSAAGAADLAEDAALAAADVRLPLPALRNHARTPQETAAEVIDRLGWPGLPAG